MHKWTDMVQFGRLTTWTDMVQFGRLTTPTEWTDMVQFGRLTTPMECDCPCLSDPVSLPSPALLPQYRSKGM